KKRCTIEHEQIVPTVIIEVDNLRSIWHWLSRQIAANKITDSICHLLEQLLPAWSHAYLYEFRYLEGKQLLNPVWTLIEAAEWETAASSKQRWVFALVASYLAQFCVGLSQFDECVLLCKRALSILSAPAKN
ncbi:hypothetical protein GWN26_03870, partial [Candidatus Saccharibacteria bacterium]|nr:hypothetical protein [Candidatus Saccharibacteria bacterium]